MSGIHIFSKDLRVVDNEALSLLVDKLKNLDNSKIIFLFHLDDSQLLDKEKAFHRSINAIIFMFQSLLELNDILQDRLLFISGDLDTLKKEIVSLKKKYNVMYLSKNLDYSDYAVYKDNEIYNVCKELNIKMIKGYDDQTICHMEDYLKDDSANSEQMYYITFSHFYNKLKKIYKKKEFLVDTSFIKDRIIHVEKNNINILYDVCSKLGINKNDLINNKFDIIQGGRKKAINRLLFLSSKKNKNNTLINFEDRDNLEKENGLKISAYLNFGCISIREFIDIMKISFNSNGESLFKQMAWRDFYLCILRFSKKAKKYIWLDDRYNKLKWRKVDDKFKLEWGNFLNCRTGILLIDASMKELKETGFMNNRARLLWATFAVKYMMSNPFDKVYGAVNLYSRHLVDCSTSQNKMNFEWIISSLDIGGRRFSKKGESPLTGRVISIDNKIIKKYNAYNYVRKWLPEYKDYTDKELLKVEPSIDLKKRYQEFCNMFK